MVTAGQIVGTVNGNVQTFSTMDEYVKAGATNPDESAMALWRQQNFPGCGTGTIVGSVDGKVQVFQDPNAYLKAGAVEPTKQQVQTIAAPTPANSDINPSSMYPQLYNRAVQPGEGYRWENGIWIAPGFDSEREYRNNLQAGAERDTVINNNTIAARQQVAASGRNPDNYYYWSSGRTIVPIPLWAWNENGATEASRTAIENAKAGAGISVFSVGKGSTTREEVQNLFRQQAADSKINTNEWGTGDQFRGILPDNTIADINAALFVGRQAAKTFFETDQSGNNTNHGGFTFTSIGKFDAGEYAVDASKLGGGLLGAALLVPGKWYDTANYIQRGIGDAAEIAYMGASALPKPVSVPINAGIGFGAAFASTLPFVMSVPYGAQWAVTNPAGVIPKAGEMVFGMGKDIWQRELTNPGAVVGTLTGMYAGGKALGYAGGKAAVYSPVDVNFFTKISTGELGKANTYTALSVKNPIAHAPVSKFLGGFAYGDDFAGVQTFRGSPVELMKGTRVGISELFDVRDVSKTPNPSQMRLLDPFLRDVAKGAADEPFILAALDLKNYMKISEKTLKYEPRQPIGTFEQTGVDPGVQMGVHEILSDSGSIRLGSSSTTDFLGKRFMRDTTASDIDVDIPKRNFADTIERLKVAYGANTQPIEFEGGGKFKLASMIGDEHLISASTVEAHADVRYYNARTLKGTISRQQTPEYGIESKASRLFDKGYTGIVYSPEAGIRVALNTKKIAADLTDIYAGSRGIAKTAYDAGNYKLGRAYEGISDNIRKYADSIGEGDVIRTIPDDILKGTYRGKGGGAILGVGFEYPSAKIPGFWGRTGKASNVMVAGYALGAGLRNLSHEEYPEGSKPAEYGYPAGIIRNPEIYPVSIGAKNNGDAYPGSAFFEQNTPVIHPIDVGIKPHDYPTGKVEIYPNGIIKTTTIKTPNAAKTPIPNITTFANSVSGINVKSRAGRADVDIVYPIKPDAQPEINLRKNYNPLGYQFKEVMPLFTGLEVMGASKTEKPFYRTIGKGFVRKVQPENKEPLNRLADFPRETKVNAQQGIEFFRAKPRKDGGGIARRFASAYEFDTSKIVGHPPKRGRKLLW